MSSAFVTGAYGLLGSWLCRALLDRGVRVAVLQRDEAAALHLETAERGALRNADQLAFERVAPVVIRALDEVTAVAFLSVEQA